MRYNYDHYRRPRTICPECEGAGCTHDGTLDHGYLAPWGECECDECGGAGELPQSFTTADLHKVRLIAPSEKFMAQRQYKIYAKYNKPADAFKLSISDYLPLFFSNKICCRKQR